MATQPNKTLMDYAVDGWYTCPHPLDPKRRAYAMAEQYELDPEEVWAACQADFADHADAD